MAASAGQPVTVLLRLVADRFSPYAVEMPALPARHRARSGLCLVSLALVAALCWPGAAPADGDAPASVPGAAFDFNGDGYADLAAPVPMQDIQGVDGAGAVHVVYGSRDGLRAQGNQMWSQGAAGVKGRPGEDDWFGLSVTSADFDGDGYGDLAAATQDSTVAVLYGNRNGLSARDQLLTPRDLGFSFGGLRPRPLVAGDLDGDGFGDLVLAEPEEGGAVSVIRGGARGLLRQNRRVIRETDPALSGRFQSDDYFGAELAVGDVDGNGVDDLLVTIENQNGSNDDSGEQAGLYLLPGRQDGRVGATSRFIPWDDPLLLSKGPIAYQELRLAAGDFDGDGFDDVAVGAPYNGEPGCGRCTGEVAVLPGGPSGPLLAGHTRWSEDSAGVPGAAERGDYFGEQVAAGDLNGDGRADLVVASPNERLGRVVAAGDVHVLYGTATGLTATGAQTWSQRTARVKGTPRRDDRFSEGGITIAHFGKGPTADLAIRNPCDGVGGTVNVLYSSVVGVTPTDQLWHQDIPGMRTRARLGEQFGGSSSWC